MGRSALATARFAAVAVAAVGAAGCVGGGIFGASSNAAVPQTSGSGPGSRSVGSEGVIIYLETMRDLLEGDPVLQADTFQNAAEAASFEPTTTNRLNYALALATPGHPSSNAVEAQRVLTELLAATNTLLPEERILATVHLKEVEQRMILDAAAQRLQQEAAAATTAQNSQTAQRLRAMVEENRQLRLELDDAREKLDAITNIERSIRERENGSDPQ